VGEDADGPFLDTTVGMLWRALVLWVVILAAAAMVAVIASF
jgi:anti-sigma-K factor RskA